MKRFDKAVLIHILARLSFRLGKPADEMQKQIDNLKEAVENPPEFKCFISSGKCVYGLSSYHLKKCPGVEECAVGMAKKLTLQGIEFI